MLTRSVKKVESVSRLTNEIKDKEGVCHDAPDYLMVMAFNAFIKSVRLPPRKQFRFPLKKEISIGNCRRIVKTWSPQSYDHGQTVQEFDVPRVLGAFFDRYISKAEHSHRELLEASAAIKFIKTNSDGDAIDAYVLDHPMLKPIIERMQNIVGGLFQDRLNVVEHYNKTGHGPNGTTTVMRRDAFIHIKNRDISGTQASLQQFHHYLLWDNQLRDTLVAGSDELRAAINGHNVPLGTVVDCTKTGFVDKSFEALRTMCPETNTVGFFSSMIATEITIRLRSIGIDLNTQPTVHKDLAKLGSLYPELNIGTIDWSEASDRIWLSLVNCVFSKADPSWINFMVNVCRHRATSVTFKVYLGNEFKDEEELTTFLVENCSTFSIKKSKKRKDQHLVVTCELLTNMFATMGNPLTFPLQTLIFYAFLTSATELAEEQQTQLEREVYHFPSSFGDDGIVDVRAFPVVEHYARLLGWKLNKHKSFVEGGFRESCGGDYYHGRPCRPFSPKRPPDIAYEPTSQGKRQLQAWVYIVANNLQQLLVDMGFNTFPIEEFLLEAHALCKFGKICIVPPSFPDGSGFRVSSSVHWTGLTLRKILPPRETDGNKVIHREVEYPVIPFDFCDIDSQIPGYLRGLGLDTPTNEVCPSYQAGRYHWPYYSWCDRTYSFKAIVSQPSDRLLEDEWVVDHYYINGLKMAENADNATLSQIHASKSFYDIDVTDQKTLVPAQVLTNKECKLYKTTTTTTLWL